MLLVQVTPLPARSWGPKGPLTCCIYIIYIYMYMNQQPKWIVVITHTQCPLCRPSRLMNFMHLDGTQQNHISIYYHQPVSDTVSQIFGIFYWGGQNDDIIFDEQVFELYQLSTTSINNPNS